LAEGKEIIKYIKGKGQKSHWEQWCDDARPCPNGGNIQNSGDANLARRQRQPCVKKKKVSLDGTVEIVDF